MKNTIKNILISALLILCVVQVALLWFDDTTAIEIPFIVAKSPSLEGESLEDARKPARVIISDGDGSFIIRYNNLSQGMPAFDRIMMSCLSIGEYQGQQAFNWTKFSDRGVMAAEYNFLMPGDLFAVSLSQKTTNFTNRVKGFDLVFAAPADENSLTVGFVDQKSGLAQEFRVSDQNLTQSLIEVLSDGQKSNIRYTLSEDLADLTGIFEKPGFVPVWNGELKYPGVMVSNPYEINGELLIDNIEKQVDVFFDIPASKWTSNTMPYTYKDETTVVKYYPNNVLEYSLYRTGTTTLDSFSQSYLAALGIIKKDGTITNDFYLTRYENDTDNGVWRFYFDYAINDIPLRLSEYMAQTLEISHMLEVTVVNGTVTRYRRLIYNFDLDKTEVFSAGISYRDVTNEMLTFGGAEDGSVDGLELCYRIDNEPVLSLYWAMRTGEATFMRPAD